MRENKSLHKTKVELKVRITETLTNLNKESVGKTCQRFRSHLEAKFEANRDFFK